jgi:hypothetical protein
METVRTRKNAACLVLAVGLSACGGSQDLPGLSGLERDCQSEPTQICLQTPGGNTVLSPEDGQLRISVDDGVYVRFWPRGTNASSFSLRFTPPPHGQIVPGVYRDAVQRWGLTPAGPQLDVDGPKSSCRGPGNYILHDIAFDRTGEKIERLDVAFEVGGCGEDQELVRGRVRVNASPASRLARFLPAKAPATSPAQTLDLEHVGEICPVAEDRFLCLQGDAAAWVAAGRRKIIGDAKGRALVGALDPSGAARFDLFNVHLDDDTRDPSVVFSPRWGTPFAPGLYDSAGSTAPDERQPFLSVGQCRTMPGPTRFYVYEAEFEPKGKVRRFLADFEAHCGGQVVIGRIGRGSALVAKAKIESGGDPDRFTSALSRLLDARRKQTAAAPRTEVSLEALDRLCPDREGGFFCLQGTAGDDMAGGRSFQVGPPLVTGPLSFPHGGLSVTLTSYEMGISIAPPPGEELRPGTLYENATCNAFAGQGPYLAIRSLDLAGTCAPGYSGRFRLRSLERGADGSIQKLEFDFDMKARLGSPVAGRVRADLSRNTPTEPQAAADPSTPEPPREEAPAAAVPASPPVAAVPESDARCEADGRTFDRRGGVWMESGTERGQPARTLTRGQDPKLDLEMMKARVWSALNLGPVVRVRMNGEDVEVHQAAGLPKDPFAGVRCEVFGKVRLPRRSGEMGSTLDDRLRQDGKRGLHVGAHFVVGRDGKVTDLLAADGLPEEYRPLLLADLQKLAYIPGTLDGKPVPVVQAGSLDY